MAEMKTIQKRLDERADKKLEADVRAATTFAGFQWSDAKIKLDVGDGKQKDFYVGQIRSALQEALTEYHRQDYRDREAKEFLDEFEQLRGQMADLEARVES